MDRTLLDTIHIFQKGILHQYDETLDEVRELIQSNPDDREGISQRLGFLAVLQVFDSITEKYLEDWNFVSTEDFERAIAVAGDQFRAYISEARIIPNDGDWFSGVKAQLLERLDQIIKEENFLDQAVEKSLEELSDITVEEIKAGFSVATDFIQKLDVQDIEIHLSKKTQQKMDEECEQAEKDGHRILEKLLQRFRPN